MTNPIILFVTSPEHGQANCQIATITALQQLHPQAQIHLASFEALRPRCPKGVSFHAIKGQGLAQYYKLSEVGTIEVVCTSPGFWGTISAIIRMVKNLQPETPEDYVKTALDAQRLIEELRPTMIVCDPIIMAPLDAVMRSDVPHIRLSPNTLKEVAASDQESATFSFPSFNVGYDYPMTYFETIKNGFLILFTGLWAMLLDPKVKMIQRARHAAGYKGPHVLFAPRDCPVLCMSHPSVEYPMKIPDDIVTCGPILQQNATLEDADPEMSKWINNGKHTVLIALGSHWKMTEEFATIVLTSVRVLLDRRPDVQVLWKLQKLGEYELEGAELGDRLKILSWLTADPVAIMETGKVVCVVNHGGSNSYHEALATGTPQVIMSPWYDCHDFGARVGWLGIGKWGNKKHAPHCSEPELTSTLLAVVGSTADAPEALKILKKAKEVAKIINSPREEGSIHGFKGDPKKFIKGRDIAAEFIWERTMAAMKV